MKAVHYVQDGIDQCCRPSHDQRATAHKNAVPFPQYSLRIRQVLKYRQHHDMVELRIFEWEPCAQIRVNAPPPTMHPALDLVVNADTVCDLVFGKIQKRHLQSAA